MKSGKAQSEKTATNGEDTELIKIRRNFQLTIPSELRRRINLSVGDYVEVDVEDNKIVIRPVEVAVFGKKTRRELAREKAFLVLDEIWAKLKDENPQGVEKLVDEAIKEVRKKR
jgi:AbrB family looped-hinge helix DNA binding protein